MAVIYPPTLDYHVMVQRPQQVMRQFARHGQRVFFCNLTQQPGTPPEEAEPNLLVVHDHEDFLSRIVPELQAPLVWCSWAKLHDRLDAYRPGRLVFDAVDDFPQWRKYEAPMLKRASAVTASSAALLRRFSGRHPRVVLLPNGCEYDFLSAPPTGGRPHDLPPPPVAGFIGAWAPWIDSDLMERVAMRLGNWNFAVIGPPFGQRRAAGQNIAYLGYRPYAQLPSYLHHLDVALIPFRQNAITEAANPVKLWEYLAAGCPVVSTPLPEVLPHTDAVRVAEGAADFAEAILLAGHDRAAEKRAARQELARRNSWAMRYDQLIANLSDIVQGV